MSTVVVFGATGYAGGHITSELLGRGHTVVGAARDASALEAREGLRAKSGSIFDAAFVAEAVAGADAVVVAVRAHGGEKPLVAAVTPLLGALADTGARLGVVGGAGSLLTAPGGPLVIGDNFPEAALGEAGAQADVLGALKAAATDVDWFYVSPAKSFGSWVPGERTGKFRLGDDVAVVDDKGESFISGADLAIAFVDEIEKPAHHRVRFTLGY